jgi:hypothetical protein
MNEHPDLTPPTIGGADHAHAAVRAGLSAIPFAGGAAMEIFNAVITPPIERRRQQWMATVGSAIEQLQTTDANIVETLQNSEKFQSVLLQASWAAVRNHQRGKLDGLRNAVLNAAQGFKASADLQLLFVRYVDELTPVHLLVMSFFVKHEGDVAQFESYQKLFAAFSEITQQKIDGPFFKLACDDLKARSLVRISDDLQDFPGLYDVTSLAVEKPSSNPKIIVTDVGRAFFEFVLTDPSGFSK